MSDLEKHLYDQAGGAVHSIFIASGNDDDEWLEKIEITGGNRICIVSILVCFRTDYAADGDECGASMVLSSGASDAEVDAASDNITILDHIEVASTEQPFFMNFEGCPIIGLDNQSLWLKGFTLDTAHPPNITVQYMVLP